MFTSRRMATAAVAVALAGAGLLATAGQAQAASLNDCPNNNVCLWSGPNGTGTLLFQGNGTTMHDNPTYFNSGALAQNPHAQSFVNRTLGPFCTYTDDKRETNRMGQQTFGNLSNHDTHWVKIC
jgi:Tfp pilus assembly protein FimT